MNPMLILLIGILWVAFFGGTILAYLDKKFDKWGMGLVVLFILALVFTLLAVFGVGGGTPTMN
jgi:tetrahydromethanopterin S-methyltransferase subunit D